MNRNRQVEILHPIYFFGKFPIDTLQKICQNKESGKTV